MECIGLEELSQPGLLWVAGVFCRWLQASAPPVHHGMKVQAVEHFFLVAVASHAHGVGGCSVESGPELDRAGRGWVRAAHSPAQSPGREFCLRGQAPPHGSVIVHLDVLPVSKPSAKTAPVRALTTAVGREITMLLLCSCG